MPPPLCWDAERCKKPWCKFTHPGDPNYDNAPLSRAHKDKLRESGASFESQDSGYSRSRDKTEGRQSATDSGWADSGWADSRRSNGDGGGWGSSGPQPSTWGSASPAAPSWGASSSGAKDGGWGSASPAHVGWGNTGPVNEGWGRSASPTAAGWGKSTSPAGGGWGSASPGGGWGNSESASRRTSGRFENNKSPANLPPSSPRGDKVRPPSRSIPPSAPASYHNDRDREHEGEREHGREKDHGKETERGRVARNSSPSRHRHSRQHSPDKSSSAIRSSRNKDRERDRSPDKRRESTDLPNAMDMDPPLPPPASLSTAPSENLPGSEPGEVVSTYATATMPMPPPPLPLGASSRPTAAHVPPGNAPAQPPSFPPPPSSVPMMPPPPPPSSVPIISPLPISQTEGVPSTSQAEEWVRLLDALLQRRRTYEHLKHRITKLEELEKHRTIPNPAKRSEKDPGTMLAAARIELDQLQKDVQTLTDGFAVSMKVMCVSTIPPNTDMSRFPDSTMTHGKESEALALGRSLSDQVSKLQSEVKLIEAELNGFSEVSKGVESLKEEIHKANDGVDKEGDSRTRGLDGMEIKVTAVKADVGTMKQDLEGMKQDIGNAFRGLGDAKQELGKVKSQHETLRETVEKVEQQLRDVQKEKRDISTEYKHQFKQLRQQVAQLKQSTEDSRQETERITKENPVEKPTAPGKRDRDASVPAGDAMDVDEPRPTKRVRLAVADPTGVAPEVDGPLSPSLTQDIGGPSNVRLKEMYDRLQDYVATLESEIIYNHEDVCDRLEEFAERMGWEPIVYPGSTGVLAEPSTSQGGRAESAPPASSSKADQTGTMRSSAPPDLSTERTKNARTKLPTLVEEDNSDSVSGSTPENELSIIRGELDAVMAQMSQLYAAEGQWPNIVGKNLAAAMGVQSLGRIWEKVVGSTSNTNTEKRPEVNGKHVNGTSPRKEEQDDRLALVIAEQARQAQRMEDMRTRLEQSEREKEAILGRLSAEEKKTAELKSLLEDISKPGNSLDEIIDHAARMGSSPIQREVEDIKRFAMTLPSMLQIVAALPEK